MRSVSTNILLPVSAAAAFSVLTDLNTLIRLSPYFTLKHIEPLSDESAEKGDRFRVTIEYYATKMTDILEVQIDELETNRLISYTINNGMVKNIRYEIEHVAEGLQLTQTFQIDSENEALIEGTRSELDAWLKSVGNYMKLSGPRSLLKSVWKCFMDRVWLRLSLSERNIALIMVKISLLELALLLMLVLIWNIGVLR